MKKMVRRAAAALLAVVLALSLAGCGGAEAKERTSGQESTAARTVPAPSREAGQKLKLTVCIQNKDDLSFGRSLYEGAMRVQEELQDQYEVTISELGQEEEGWKQALEEAAGAGSDLIAAAGYQFEELMIEEAAKYPQIRFILFDDEIEEGRAEGNLLSVLFDSRQSAYLAGAAAAYYTVGENAANTDKTIGFLGGEETETVRSILDGYTQGAEAVDPDIKILTGFVGSFEDPDRAKELAQGQIREGADILMQAAGGSGMGVIQAASEKDGVLAVGADSDQYEALEGSELQPAVLTSSLKRLDYVLLQICSEYAKDPASVAFGTTVGYGLENGGVGIVYNENLVSGIGEEQVEKLREIEVKLRSGELQIQTEQTANAHESVPER